jgi:hypothetical protein
MASGFLLDHDVLLGARWAFHYAASTAVVGGPVIDYRTGEAFAFLEAQRRIGSRFLAEPEARCSVPSKADPTHGLRRDDVVTLKMSRYF